MPTTTEALVIALLFLAPGLLYDYGVIRSAPYRRPDTGERLWRAFANSLIFQAAALPFTFLGWRHYGWTDLSHAPIASLVALGLVAGAYVAVPYGAGTLRGRRVRSRISETPSGWDHAFRHLAGGGYVRVKLKTGEWIAGLYAHLDGQAPPYASGYPNDPTAYLPAQLEVDPFTGAILLDGAGRARVREWGVLLRAEDCERVEFQAMPRGAS